jgi:hypothetical protein
MSFTLIFLAMSASSEFDAGTHRFRYQYSGSCCVRCGAQCDYCGAHDANGKTVLIQLLVVLNKQTMVLMRADTHPGLIDKNISLSPHLLRHSKATHLVNSGVHIFNVRDFLGHESIATTQVYLTTNAENTRKALENAASCIGVKAASTYSQSEITDLENFGSFRVVKLIRFTEQKTSVTMET